ncbi:MAG: UMP kinase [Candidatus Gracilibacteria bacterium]|jgi:uridylate kinase
MKTKKARRILLKVSGEMMAEQGQGADAAAVLKLAQDIKALWKKKIQVAIVMGGGNFWRYRDNKKLSISRSASDAIGMLATMMNARLLQEALESIGVPAKSLSAHGNFYFTEPYVPSRGKALLDKGTVVICGGGTGNAYFTTDTAAALRALELECSVLLKETKVSGVYDKDPMKYKNAKLLPKISYEEVLKRELQVMDLSAILLCSENKLPIVVFQGKAGNLLKAATGKKIGSIIS